MNEIECISNKQPLDFFELSNETSKLIPFIEMLGDEAVEDESIYVDPQMLRNLLNPSDLAHEWYLGFLLRQMKPEQALRWLVSKWNIDLTEPVVRILYLPRTNSYFRDIGTLFDIGCPVKFEGGNLFFQKSMIGVSNLCSDGIWKLHDNPNDESLVFLVPNVRNVQKLSRRLMRNNMT